MFLPSAEITLEGIAVAAHTSKKRISNKQQTNNMSEKKFYYLNFRDSFECFYNYW